MAGAEILVASFPARWPAKSARGVFRRASHRLTELAIPQQLRDPTRDVARVARIDEIPCFAVPNQIRHAAPIRSDHGHARRHGFLDPERRVFFERDEREDAR